MAEVATKPSKPKCLLAGVKGPEVTWAAKYIMSQVSDSGLTGNETEGNFNGIELHNDEFLIPDNVDPMTPQ